MGYSHLFVGVGLIGLGFLVKAFPMLIAGYNTATKNQREEWKRAGLPRVIRNGLIAIGLILITGHYFFVWLGYYTIAELVPPLTVLIGVLILFIYSLRFKTQKKKL